MKPANSAQWLYKQTKPLIPSLLVVIGIGMIVSVLGVLSAVASKYLVDYAVENNMRQAVIALIAFLVMVFSQIGARAYLSNKTTRISESYCNKIRLNIYQKLVRAAWNDFTQFHSDDILTRLTSDINIVKTGMVDIIPNIIMLGLQLAFAFLTLFYYDKILAVLAIVLGPFSLLFYRLFRKKLKDLHLKIQKTEGLYRAYLHECVQNVSILKVFSMEEHSCNELRKLQDDRVEWVVKRNKVNIAASSILSVGYYIGFVLSFAWGAYRLSEGLITFGTLTIFFQLVNQIQGPFITIARVFPQLIAAEGSASRLMEMENISQEPEIQHKTSIGKAGVKFENLSFRYHEDRPVLQDVTATIREGEIVSIIGPSGEGKTTLVRIVLSLLEKDKGSVRLVSGNAEEFSISPSCRNIISYVPQGNTLFSGSILENIRMGKPDATEEEIQQALKDACADVFVNSLTDGIHSIVGERGIGLSEGQAQRLAIARALIRNAPILILDEATSALDEETELKVLNAIKAKNPRPTCLLITHRPTVYNLTDRVLRLKNGVLVEKAG